MKLITAAIYTNFSTYVVDDSNIEQLLDGPTAVPKGKVCLRFEKAN